LSSGEPAVRKWSKWLLILILASGSAPAGELNFGTPVVFGDVVRFEAGGETRPRELSRGQLQGLTLWLGLHRSAWRGLRRPAPNAKRLLRLNLKDAAGESASMDVIAQAGSGVVLRLIRSDTWSYKSFWGLVKSAAAAQPLSDDELAVLKKILGAT
jgi:hypothetical protein